MEGRTPPIDAVVKTTSRAELDLSKTTCEVIVGEASLNFGLCLPLSDGSSKGSRSVQSWQLYEVVVPSLTGWIHAAFRLSNCIESVIDNRNIYIQLGFGRLVINALDSDEDQVFVSTLKSTFAKARVYHRHLVGCPSCQLLLTLIRYNTVVTSVDRVNEYDSDIRTTLLADSVFREEYTRHEAVRCIIFCFVFLEL